MTIFLVGLYFWSRKYGALVLTAESVNLDFQPVIEEHDDSNNNDDDDDDDDDDNFNGQMPIDTSVK
jgi:hypothetical protein